MKNCGLWGQTRLFARIFLATSCASIYPYALHADNSSPARETAAPRAQTLAARIDAYEQKVAGRCPRSLDRAKVLMMSRVHRNANHPALHDVRIFLEHVRAVCPQGPDSQASSTLPACADDHAVCCALLVRGTQALGESVQALLCDYLEKIQVWLAHWQHQLDHPVSYFLSKSPGEMLKTPIQDESIRQRMRELERQRIDYRRMLGSLTLALDKFRPGLGTTMQYDWMADVFGKMEWLCDGSQEVAPSFHSIMAASLKVICGIGWHPKNFHTGIAPYTQSTASRWWLRGACAVSGAAVLGALAYENAKRLSRLSSKMGGFFGRLWRDFKSVVCDADMAPHKGEERRKHVIERLRQTFPKLDGQTEAASAQQQEEVEPSQGGNEPWGASLLRHGINYTLNKPEGRTALRVVRKVGDVHEMVDDIAPDVIDELDHDWGEANKMIAQGRVITVLLTTILTGLAGAGSVWGVRRLWRGRANRLKQPARNALDEISAALLACEHDGHDARLEELDPETVGTLVANAQIFGVLGMRIVPEGMRSTLEDDIAQLKMTVGRRVSTQRRNAERIRSRWGAYLQ